jgi:hypothetical protein
MASREPIYDRWQQSGGQGISACDPDFSNVRIGQELDVPYALP